jgi:hypothetical protein
MVARHSDKSVQSSRDQRNVVSFAIVAIAIAHRLLPTMGEFIRKDRDMR